MRGLEVVGLVYSSLGEMDPALGEPLRRALRGDWNALVAASMIHRHIYERLSEALSGAGVRHAPLKGQDLAYRVYQSPEMRPMCDIDVLVPGDQLDAACSVIEEKLGARADAWSLGDSPWQRTYYNRHYRVDAGDASVLIEVHQRLGHVHHDGIDWSAVWRRATPTGERDHELYLAAEDLIIVLCYHLMRSLYPRRLHWMLDLEGVDRELSPSWSTVATRARQWNLATGVWLTLQRSAQALGRSVAPAETVLALRPHGLRAAYLEQLFNSDVSDRMQRLPIRLLQALATFPLMDGWAHRARFAQYYLALRLTSAWRTSPP